MDEEKNTRCIIPPTDESIRQRLALKLEEYRQRLAGKDKPWEYQHPELAHSLHQSYRDAYYKVYILEKVLQSQEPVNTWALSQELHHKWKGALDINTFASVCAVIDQYCGNCPDEPLIGGTGLPELPQEKP